MTVVETHTYFALESIEKPGHYYSGGYAELDVTDADEYPTLKEAEDEIFRRYIHEAMRCRAVKVTITVEDPQHIGSLQGTTKPLVGDEGHG